MSAAVFISDDDGNGEEKGEEPKGEGLGESAGRERLRLGAMAWT